MSETMSPTVEVSISKAKVGPLTKRYHHGEFREIEQPDDGPKRVAICGIDNSHNGDYKVAYASDPMLVVESATVDSHDVLKEVLERHGLWKDEYQPIHIPHGSNEWKVGFKSLPRSANEFDLMNERVKKAVERDLDVMCSENSVTGYLPTN